VTPVVKGSRVFLWLLLTGVWVAAAVFVAHRLFDPPQPKIPPVVVTESSESGVEAQASESFFEVPPLDDYEEIVERPLFMDTRRPPPDEPEPVAEEEPQQQDEELTLIGVMVMPNAQYALVEVDDKQGKIARLRVGQEANGWKLEAVHANRIVMIKGDSKKELPLIRNQPSPNRAKRIAETRRRQRQLAKRQERQANRQKLRPTRDSNENAPKPGEEAEGGAGAREQNGEGGEAPLSEASDEPVSE
jgi:hypothetical protein